jgi:carbonic anhydrase
MMSATDNLLDNAQQYAATFTRGDLPAPPALQVAVLACMDARLNPYGLLGLSEGDAHVLRNAGGVVTEDELRSLAISQRVLGTTEIILIQHTDCGMRGFPEDEFIASIEAETGRRPSWTAEPLGDPDSDVRESLDRIVANPFIPHKHSIRGFVYEVETGKLREVPLS